MRRVLRFSAMLLPVLVATSVRAGEESVTLRDDTGSELITTRCVICHSVDYVPMNAPVMTRARWEASVRKMIEKFGAPITQDDSAQIVDYLSKNYAGGS
jgi:sulfite dehydrogenase (cytochrome) subunit B